MLRNADEERTSAKMGIDGHVTRCSAQTLAFTVGYVLLCLGIPVLLRHAKVDHMDDVRALRPRPADEEVVGLDVAVNQIFLVNCLHSRNQYEGIG